MENPNKNSKFNKIIEQLKYWQKIAEKEDPTFEVPENFRLDFLIMIQDLEKLDFINEKQFYSLLKDFESVSKEIGLIEQFRDKPNFLTNFKIRFWMQLNDLIKRIFMYLA